MTQTSTLPTAAIAASIDAPPGALPLIPDLFAPLSALGSHPRRVVAWLRKSGIRRGDRLLDLGCGKGAVAVASAASLGCRITAVDVFVPFIEAAAQLARRRRVAALCDFRREPVERWRRKEGDYDAVLMLAVWPVLPAAKLVRRLTRPGGVYVIDDAVWVGGDLDSGRPRDVPTADEVRRALESEGDRVEREHIALRSETLREEMAVYGLLRRQAAKMARRNPRRRRMLRQCLRHQRDAIAALTGPLRGAMWLVRRTG